MARTAKNQKLDTRTARDKLAERRDPYWTVISRGCAIGYRKGAKGGTWIARMRAEDGKQHFEALGAADDRRDADGQTVLSFTQAQAKAREVFDRKTRELAGHIEALDGPYTVAQAISDYFVHRTASGSKGVKSDVYAANAQILPVLGKEEVARLTPKRIREWHAALATAPRLVRSKKLAEQRAQRAVDAKDPEEVRKRRSTANRLLTVLKAALNFAYAESKAASDEAWRRVKPFAEVNAARVRYLQAEECKRLVNACPPDFRALVRGALATGCRYGELTRLRVADFNADVGTVTIGVAKGAKARHIALADEGRAIFSAVVAGKTGNDLVFRREDGGAWKASHQQRPLIEASAAAKIEPAPTFHVLRHTYGSALAMKGVPMGVIAAQLGHSDTRMTEKHYAHLAPSYVADTVRASLPALADFQPDNVVDIVRNKR